MAMLCYVLHTSPRNIIHVANCAVACQVRERRVGVERNGTRTGSVKL